MPKKIPITEKREWLALYEGGQSEASVARDKKRDLNVIKRGLQEARNERNLAAAQSQMLATALRQHQDKLATTLSNIMDGLVVPDVELVIPRKVTADNPVKLANGQVKYDSKNGLFVTMQGEDTIHWQLVKEHLRRDRLWAKLEHWKQAMVVHIRARIDLRIKAEGLLEGGTGLRVLLTDIDHAPGNDYLYETVVTLFYRSALEESLEAPDREVLNEDMMVVSEPYVKYVPGNLPLAHCFQHPAECRSKMIAAHEKLMKSEEVKVARATYQHLWEATAKVRALAEEIMLLGLIPGQCRVCRRLGM